MPRAESTAASITRARRLPYWVRPLGRLYPLRQLSRPMPSAAAGRSLNPFRVLATHRNFRLFWLGQTLSLVGTWMQSMAQGWLALQLSDSAFLVGVVAFAGSIPILLFSFPAGVVVDRADKLRLVTL